ncbi:hypothetical protein APUTEX25_004952, partial [Auxenochlorella protothecoides]
GPFTTADILVAVKATVHGTYYNKPVAQATIPPERADDFLQDEGRMCPTHKTASTAVLLSRVVWIAPKLREGLAWHMHLKPFRKLRHQAYVGRERAITRLAEQFRAPPGMTTVVGYVRVHNGVEKLVDVWDTKRCTNRGCKVNVVNRDVNGVVNMLMLLKCFFAGALRPTAFGGPPAPPSPAPPPLRFAIRGNQLRQPDPACGKQLCNRRKPGSGISSTRAPHSRIGVVRECRSQSKN